MRRRIPPMKNSAAITPNSATNAGSSNDCDNAAANGSCRNPGNSRTADSWAAGPPGPDGIRAPICCAMNAAIPALPSTEPTWRVAL